MSRHWVVILGFLLLTSCAARSPRRLDNLNLALKSIQASIIESLPLGKPAADRRGMIYRSRYFIPVGRKVRLAERSNVRFQAVVYILGSSRPYSVEVEVVRQKRTGGPWTNPIYTDVGKDNRMAQIIVRRIQKRLYHRSNKKNVVDDFRVF